MYAIMYMYMYMWRWIMKVMSMSESRANYAATLDSVIDDQEEVVITRPGGEDVVMIPLRAYESMRETLYLMSSPVNRQRISRSIDQLNGGSGQVHELMEPDGNGE
jgi:antitoxin YefM